VESCESCLLLSEIQTTDTHVTRSKYPLAIVDVLIDAYGERVGCGYDIGCRFATTLAQSSLGKKSADQSLRMLVGPSMATHITDYASSQTSQHT
jgi:Kyakuja-Dileera-Zisupton transposase